MGQVENENVVPKVIVVGMNRPRLLKIMAMVDDEMQKDNNFPNVEYVPCLIMMTSYKNEHGEAIRYMSNFMFHDGSPMNTFFDDEAFRESLSTVVMVGYEWKENDEKFVENYFESSLLSVPISCISPNPDFSSLREEMNHFKNLTDEEKEEHSSNHTMGPKKMKRFILDTLKPLQLSNAKKEAIETEQKLSQEETKEEQQQQQNKRTPGFIDHNLTTFACRMCRTILCGENNLVEDHKQALHSFKRKPNNSSGASACQSLFCDESVLEWLAPDGTDVEGKLTCPYCDFKIGHWNWSGAQCSCGTWVVPAIQIPHGKIDVILPPSERIKISPMMIVTPKEP